MNDKCCRHKRLLSHDCVKCIKYKDSQQLKRSLLNEQLKRSMLIRFDRHIELLSKSSAGVTPVDVFSTVFMIRCTNGSCS